ncbi:TetR/AcrR family transcriptional regulator [Frankia sp. CiP3]|uniref:TetR/AcrR family transcriptional regulator n=1 Tax=Frankia sp. CiP3 TaxID=2880971 RepID=UPI001EF5F58B|nr:TetR/AcrR family transcriptional regulator [Frankia sp. CiP3]
MAEPANLPERGRPPAHRPSRRQIIISAAIRVFARKGFDEASVQDIAAAAQVVPTAVYYHFSGKEELFDVALRRVVGATNAVVAAARSDDEPGDFTALRRVTAAVWDWIEAHPDEARLLYLHMPGATQQARTLRRDFEELHIERSFDYIVSARVPATRRSAVAKHATQSLAARTLNHLLLAIHPMRMDDGPLSQQPPKALRRALDAVSERILTVD